MLIAAESKREEEKAKGMSTDDTADNPDIVLYEDNEEEEEEESEEEDETSGQAGQGRGRGRGAMWHPHMPMVRGARPILGGFPPMMMGADGFGYGAVTPDGFGAPDLFGVPRAFAPFGAPPMGFPGRPGQPRAMFPMGGLGMMMGRAPFVGGMGMARPTRPVGMPPFIHPPPPPNSRNVKRDQRRPASDRSDRHEPGLDQGSRGQEIGGPGGGGDEEGGYQPGSRAPHEDRYGAGSNLHNDESESEDEAPRRSRYGEGKRKRRGSDGEAASDQWETPFTEV